MAAPCQQQHSAWKQLIKEYLAEALPDNAQIPSICKAIQSGFVKLHDVVEDLQEHLTSTQVDERAKGTKLLAAIQHGLPKDMLSVEECNFIVAFFCDRLKDHHSVVPHVLNALLALVKYKELSDEQAIKIVQAIFQEAHTQTHVHSDRCNVFTLLAVLIDRKLDCLVRVLDVNFVYGYIQAIDGEKDPRNLVIIFNSVPIIVKYFPLGEMAEELFDVVSCYFPVDFQPPENNPFLVTREDLESGLRKCMTATPKFTDFCIPLIEEKLDSDIIDAKLDSLKLLCDAADKFGIATLSKYVPGLWSALRKQYFSSKNDQVEKVVLKAVQAISKCVSTDASHEAFEPFFSSVVKECKHHIIDADSVLRHAGCRLLEAVSSGMINQCQTISHHILPLLATQYGSHSLTVNKDILLFSSSFLNIFRNYFHDNTDDKYGKMVDDLQHLYLSEISSENSETRSCCVIGLQAIINQSNAYVSNDMLIKIVNAVNSTSTSECDKSVNVQIGLFYEHLACSHPTVISELVIPQLMHIIKDSKSSEDNVEHAYRISISIATSNIQLVSPFVHTLLDVIQFKLNSDPIKCLSCLQKILQSNKLDESLYVILDKLIDLTAKYIVNSNGHWNESTLNVFTTCIRLIVQQLDTRLATESVKLIINRFIVSNEKCSLEAKENKLADLNILVAIFEAVISCTVPQALLDIEHDQLKVVLSNIVQLSIHSECQLARVCSCRSLAAIINKINVKNEFRELVTTIIDLVEKDLNDNNIETAKNAVSALAWISKGCIMAHQFHSSHLIQKLIELVGSESQECAAVATDAFQVIMQECDEVLNNKTHANVRLMYRQRFFIETSTKLLEGFNGANEQQKANYLTALTHQMKFLPQQVLLSQADLLIPIVVQSFKIANSLLMTSSLQTISLFLNKHPNAFANYINDLIPLLLTLTQHKQSLVVRKCALECLLAVTFQPEHTILRHKDEVVKKLANCLDDHKRLVRQVAAQTRCQWFLIGAAGS